jgi:glycosyltransferase involved in cell wall biosynthesis
MKLSVLIPVFNEERYLAEVLDRVLGVDLSPLGVEREVVLVDDCSTDGTWQALENYARRDEIRVFRHERNRGKGAALRTAVESATGDVLLIQDADLEYDPDEYPKLLTPILTGKADVVYGSRFAGGEPHRVLYFWHYLGNKALTVASNALTDLNLTDMETCYKVFKAEVLKEIVIEEDRFGFEPEITAKVARLFKERGCRIFEVGISYSGRTYDEGKKITWKDAVSAIRCILKYNLLRK